MSVSLTGFMPPGEYFYFWRTDFVAMDEGHSDPVLDHLPVPVVVLVVEFQSSFLK